MPALGALFHEDATLVNRFRHYVRGVDDIVRLPAIGLHAPIHSTIDSDSALANELIDVVAINSEAAIVHFWSRLAVGWPIRQARTQLAR